MLKKCLIWDAVLPKPTKKTINILGIPISFKSNYRECDNYVKQKLIKEGFDLNKPIASRVIFDYPLYKNNGMIYEQF